MSISINTIVTEQKIDLSTLENFLKEKFPNEVWGLFSTVSEEQYISILKHFGIGTRLQSWTWKEDLFTDNAADNREILNNHGWHRMRRDTMIIFPSKYVLIPKDQNVQVFEYWTESDFSAACQDAIDKNEIIKELLTNPSGYIPVLPFVPEQRNSDAQSSREAYNQSSQELYKIERPATITNPSIVGSIDLSAINAATRPQKDSTKRIRLSKITKQYNISLRRVVDTLRKHGIYVEQNLNSRIDERHIELFEKEFGVSKPISTVTTAPQTPTLIRLSKITLAFNINVKHACLILRKYNINCEQNLNTRVDRRVIALFRKELGEPQYPDALDVVKRNNPTDSPSTRQTPQKKADATKQTSHQQNKYQKQKSTNNNSSSEDNNNPSESQELIKEIWQRHIEIQERLLQERSHPISIIPESAHIENKKLIATLDTRSNDQAIEEILCNRLHATSYDLSEGCIHFAPGVLAAMSDEQILSAQDELRKYYVTADLVPGIYANIRYGNDVQQTELLSLNELRALDEFLKTDSVVEGKIDDKVAFIAGISIDMESYLANIFGKNLVCEDVTEDGRTFTNHHVSYTNQYIPQEVFQEYNEKLGLKLLNAQLLIKAKGQSAFDFLEDYFGEKYDEDRGLFILKKNTINDFEYSSFDAEINSWIRAIRILGAPHCPQKDLVIDVNVNYCVDKHLIATKFHDIIEKEILDDENISFNKIDGQIGIDFNWRTDDILEIKERFEKRFEYISLQMYDNHRFKCKVETKIKDIEKYWDRLREVFETIEIEEIQGEQAYRLKVPCLMYEYHNELEDRLKSTLVQLQTLGAQVEIEPWESGIVKVKAFCDRETQQKDAIERLKELAKADFGADINGIVVPLGKLLRSNFPEVMVDITSDEEVYPAIATAVAEHKINLLVPQITGDLEKIARLKKTYNMAATGEQLANDNMKRFMFDSSYATKTEDIRELLMEDGVAMSDLRRHLLNPHVNASQRRAILKAMYADDLAVIQGPPGTGKSTAIAEMIWQLVRKGFEQGNKRERILLTSETNLAVDNAIARIINKKTNLVKPIRFGGEEKLEAEGLQFSLELMRKWVEQGDSVLLTDDEDEEGNPILKTDLVLKNWLDNIARRSFGGSEDGDISERWHRYLSNPNGKLRQMTFDRYKRHCNVVGATCSSIGDTKSGEQKGYTQFFHNFYDVFCPNPTRVKKNQTRIEFTTVIQDESSKATPAELVLPFVYGRRAIVIGDHRQLPPMLSKEEFTTNLDFDIENTEDEKERKRLVQLREFVENKFDELEVSHFERLYKRIDGSLKGTFHHQYRMHPDINDVIRQFYIEDGGLECGLTTPKDLGVNDPDIANPFSRYHGIDIPGIIDPDTHVMFIESTTPEMKDGTSRVNYGEIEIVDKLLTQFEQSDSFANYLSKFDSQEDKQIGVISFYGKQIRLLREVQYKHQLPIRVSTVDRFQGMERNIVIVSMVRSDKIQSHKGEMPNYKKYPSKGYQNQKRLGFAESPNRLNVALSRAKRLLIIVGNRELFSTLNIYHRLFTTIDNNPHNKVLTVNDL